MELLCLVGRHGSGKSTIGAALGAHGYKHLSVGLLRRLAGSNQYPADIPASLMLAFRRAQPGVALATDVSQKLLRYASSFDRCVLDGFPASTEHLALLPDLTIVGVVWAPKSVREARLQQRSESTKRIWTPGQFSQREQSLAHLIRSARQTHRTFFISNAMSGPDGVDRITNNILQRV